MKKYSINVHYDMVINVEVVADSLEQAKQTAYDQSAGMDIGGAECVGHDECLCDEWDVTAEELRKMENEAVLEMVSEYVEQQTPTEVHDIAEGCGGVNWLEWVDDETETAFYNTLFRAISNCEHPRTAAFDRYARMYARQRWQEVMDAQGRQWDKAFSKAKKDPETYRVIVKTVESDTDQEHSNRYFMVDYWQEDGLWHVCRSDTAESPYDVRRPNYCTSQGYADNYTQPCCRCQNPNNATRWAERMIRAGRVLDIYADCY